MMYEFYPFSLNLFFSLSQRHGLKRNRDIGVKNTLNSRRCCREQIDSLNFFTCVNAFTFYLLSSSSLVPANQDRIYLPLITANDHSAPLFQHLF